MSLVSNASGAFLHQLYWENLSPQPTAMSAELSSALAGTFGSVESFLDEFADIALTIPGSGWAVLAYSPYLGQLVVMPVSKHDQHLIPGAMPLLVCDVWEHAYYLDHPADRAGYLRGFFEHVDWAVVARRLREALV